MKLTTIIFLFVLISGCASEPLTEQQQYDREDREIQRLERYYRDAAACKASGGMIMIDRQTDISRFNKNKPPKRGERYGCASTRDYQRIMREMGMM